MMPADLAFALLINRTTAYYQANPPVYMTYTERTHVTAVSLGRSQDINRTVAVRVADDFAVMKDLPNGGERTGQAFPIIAYFDPFSQFGFSWFANLKRVDIKLDRGQPYTLPTPEPDPSVNVVVPYFRFMVPRYAPDSTESAIHLLIDATPALKGSSFFYRELVEDSRTHLPSRIVLDSIGSDETIALDYAVIEGHWVITHAIWSATEHALVFTSKVVADVTFSDIAFPNEPPDPRLAGSPLPPPASPAPSASSQAPRP
ncbi:MAG: hypothetical protein JOY69_10510 [Candidatus Eremiobacteraeota bacterium]|nr:hypothetical protein [Candidatus Eremiobacteraeota bacterium]